MEPSGLRDWSSTFIFQGLGCNTRPAQVSRKTEKAKEKEREIWREGGGGEDKQEQKETEKLY